MKTKRFLLSLVTMFVTAVSWADIAINETNFPDANFRNFLLWDSRGSDKVLTSSEISGWTTLYVSNRNIRSMQGIEYFTWLKELRCDGNQFTSLDVSRCTKLTELYCNDNQLTSLNVSGCKAMTRLDCYNNQLATLDVTGCTALMGINCYNNKITSLDVSGCTALTGLYCYSNQIKGLAMKAFVESLPTANSSNRLYVISNENEGNVMTTSEVATATAKGWIPYYTKGDLNSYGYPNWQEYAGSEPLNSYDAEINGIYYNFIKKAKLAWVTSGEYEYTGNVEIPETVTYDGQTYNVATVTSGAFSGCTGLISVTIPNSVTTIESAAFAGCSNLTTVFIGSGVETIEDAFINCQELTDVYCYATNVPTTSSNAFKGSYVGYATLYVPGASMAAYKATVPWSGFGTFKDASSLFINEAMFPDENFRNWLLSQSYGSDGILTEEEIASVTKIDVSAPYSSSSRKIKTLQGIEHFTALTELNCAYNQITSLDMSKNTQLTSLSCNGNQLTSLDVSKNTKLTKLNCNNNKLASLDISKNMLLTELNCGSNQLTSLYVSNNTALTSLQCSGNQLTSLNISRNFVLTELNCDDNQLTSLDASKNTALTELLCRRNKLTSLNVSECSALTNLNCYNNQLTSLDVSKCTKLSRLECYGNKLTSLNVTGFAALKYLNCYSNQLTYLNVSECSALEYLYCNGNQLTYLNVSGYKALTELYCNGNQLTSLDASGCAALTRLDCYYNKLTSLNVSGCVSLQYLNCYSNQLTSLNVSGCTTLTLIHCYDNQIKGAAMDAFVASLPTVNNGTMQVIYNYNELNNITPTQVNTAKAKGWLSYCTIDGNKWQEFAGSELATEDIEINEKNFPDENFRRYLLNQSYGKDGVLTATELNSILFISVYINSNMKSLKGIEFFKSLVELHCSENQLTSLDVSKNTALTRLDCYYNKLTSLNVSGCVSLQYLNCYSNQLTSLNASGCTELASLFCSSNQLTALDVSKNTALTWLDCGGNQLTSLDVSKNTMLTWLNCSNNQLTSLNLSKNTMLTYLYCHQNQIKGAGMNALIASLPTVSNGTMQVIYHNGEQNVMTTTQVNAAKAKGWIPYFYVFSSNSWLEYAGSEPVILRGDVNGDGKVDMDDATFVTSIILGTEDATEAADVNNDGAISMPDAMFIVNKILNGKFPDE